MDHSWDAGRGAQELANDCHPIGQSVPMTEQWARRLQIAASARQVVAPEDERLSAMSQLEIDRYLAGLDEPKRSTLEALRQTILAVVPDAEQCISYGLPAFKVNGKVVAGFAAFKRHLSYLPHSGSVLSALGDDLAGYEMTKGSLHFPIDEPLPERLVRKLVTTRLEQLGIT